MSDSRSEDDTYAPLVDGLSGATCVLLLVLISFMLVVVNMVKGTQQELKFKQSHYLPELNRIDFEGAINLNEEQISRVRSSLLKFSNPTVYIYIPSSIKNREHKMLYNLLKFSHAIGLNDDLNTKRGDATHCENIAKSCLYWSNG